MFYERYVKKIFFGIILFFVIVCLTGCTNTSDDYIFSSSDILGIWYEGSNGRWIFWENKSLVRVPKKNEWDIPLCLNIFEYILKGRVKKPFIENNFILSAISTSGFMNRVA